MKKLFLLFVLVFGMLKAQTDLVFVFFKDKPNSSSFFTNPLSELSQKSLDRRSNLGIALINQDAPIEASYIQNIQNLGFSLTDKSKWLNGVAVNANAAQIALLKSQPYVDHVENFNKLNPLGKISTVKNKDNKWAKWASSLVNFNYANAAQQIDQINLRPLHIAGYTGTGISIAVIDTGFPLVDTGSAFARLRNNGQIKGGYNFISKNTDIYNTSLNAHGANCMGIIGGYIDNEFVGSAPDADFYLYATENASVEIPEEELYWLEAAEEADRVGVDIITSSLGYSEFDNPKYNYSYADMTGQKSFVARAAQIASEKGIFVLAAAGNEATANWHYIVTPADNEKVFSIGAVTSTGSSSSFSSYGPNANGMIKPDASARGSGTFFAYNNSSYSGSGTSYATPLSAGGVACLLQAIPKTSNREDIKAKLRQKASLFPSYTDQMGYGILNFGDVLNVFLGTTNLLKIPQINIYPNPVLDFVNIQSKEKIRASELYNSLGQQIQTFGTENQINIEKLNKGIYYLKIKTNEAQLVKKIIKK